MRRMLIGVGLLCCGLAGCEGPYLGGPVPYGGTAYVPPPPRAAPPATDGLQAARKACNTNYPPQVGNFTPHAECVNAAVERYAMAGERHPDLIRVQERARTAISQKIDSGTLSVRAGEQRMSEADKLIAQARRDRDGGRTAAADRNVAQVETLLQE